MLLCFSAQLGACLSEFLVPLLAKDSFGAIPSDNGVFVSFSSLLSVLAQSLGVKALRAALSDRRIVLLLAPLAALCLLCLAAVPSFAALYLLSLPSVLASTVLATTLLSLVSQRAPRAASGAVLGSLATFNAVARFLAPLIGGALLQQFDSLFAPAATGCLLYLMVPLFFYLKF